MHRTEATTKNTTRTRGQGAPQITRTYARLFALSATATTLATILCGCPCPPPGSPPPGTVVSGAPKLSLQIAGLDLRKSPLVFSSLDAIPAGAKTRLEARIQRPDGPDRGLPSNFVVDVGLDEPLRFAQVRGAERNRDGVLFAASVASNVLGSEIESKDVLLKTTREQPKFIGRRLVPHEFDERRIRPERFPIDVIRGGGSVTVDPARSLMITDVAVIEDPQRTFNPCTNTGQAGGKWTFGHLMSQLAARNGLDPAVFVERWVNRWAFDQVANDDTVVKRPHVVNAIVAGWPRLPSGALDLDRAPFRLLAIVNRVDLRDNLTYGGGSAGEARFVFGLHDRQCRALELSVIFEYGIQKSGCQDLRAWARSWKNLDQHAIGTPAYATALEAITESFVRADAQNAQLNQLRTNEFLSAPNRIWELREMQLSPSIGGHLEVVTVKQTPRFDLVGSPKIRDYVNANAADVAAARHQVPLTFPGAAPFLGTAGTTPNPSFIWGSSGDGISNREARHQFSLQTCSGCHAGETRTLFYHIRPTDFGQPPTLSGFLTGLSVADPADNTPTRQFNDLARRKQDLENLVGRTCFTELIRQRLGFIH